MKLIILNTILFNKDMFRDDFPEWLMENFHIWEEFERRALKVASKREHYSARTIVEVIRHDTAIGELKGEYKINGNFVPYLARLFALRHPRYSNLFEFREQKVAA